MFKKQGQTQTDNSGAGWVNPRCYLGYSQPPHTYGYGRVVDVLLNKFKNYFTVHNSPHPPGQRIQRISESAAAYYMEMQAANIACATPCMTAMASEMSAIAAQYYGELLAFVHFDPRSPRAFLRLQNALETRGYLGVHVMPGAGWDPRPNPSIQPVITGTEMVCSALIDLYDYCSTYDIPIAADSSFAHSSSGHRLSSPAIWADVLTLYPTLRMNITPPPDSAQRAIVYHLVSRYRNCYADLANHTHDLSQDYFAALNNLPKKILKKIMWATGWPLHRKTEADYKGPYIQHIGMVKLGDILRDNALQFLFPDHNMPSRIVFALKKKESDLPEFLKHHFNRLN